MSIKFIRIFFIFLSVILVFKKVKCDDNNSVVMKVNLNKANEHRILINKYNNEMKEKNIRNPRRFEYDESGRNAFLNDSAKPELNFPKDLQIFLEILEKLENGNCVKDTNLVLEGIKHKERWAMEMFDSFSKFPLGILYGNYYQLGNFDECIGSKKEDEENNVIVQGQYCLADIHYKSELQGRFAGSAESKSFQKNRSKLNSSIIHWSVCLPASCTTKDAKIFVDQIFSSSVENFEISRVEIDENKCFYEKIQPLSNPEIIYGCIIGIFVIFTIFATCFHFWFLRQRKKYVAYNVDSIRAQEPHVLKEVIFCFSLIQTIGKLLHTKPNELNLESICGIKFLSMCLIIAGHSLLFMFGAPVLNSNFFDEISQGTENSPFLNNSLLVDTFLLVSGFLMCRLLLIELEKRKGKVNFFILYIARFIRVTPAYAIVIGFYVSFFHRLGSGPFWDSKVGLEKERCQASWWTNMLYVNNYIGTDKLCMFQSWYLAVDYHLFIIAPFIIYPLWKIRRLGESILGFCIILSVFIPFWLTFKDNLDPTLLTYPPEITDISNNFYFVNVYMKTHMRSGSYFVGLLFGYSVHKIQTSGTKIPSWLVILGWIVSFLFGTSSMFSITFFYDPLHEISSLESAIYASLHRLSWCLAIGWVIIACVTENATLVNKFLSYKFFVPASRLTYCAYLANGLVEIYNAGVQRQPFYMSKYELTCKTLGHIVLTFSIAFLLCIFFESPIHGLEKILLSNNKIKEQKRKSTVRPIN